MWQKIIRGNEWANEIKKRSVLKRRKRRMHYNGIKAGDFVMLDDKQYRVVTLKKQSLLLLANGMQIEAQKGMKVNHK